MPHQGLHETHREPAAGAGGCARAVAFAGDDASALGANLRGLLLALYASAVAPRPVLFRPGWHYFSHQDCPTGPRAPRLRAVPAPSRSALPARAHAGARAGAFECYFQRALACPPSAGLEEWQRPSLVDWPGRPAAPPPGARRAMRSAQSFVRVPRLTRAVRARCRGRAAAPPAREPLRGRRARVRPAPRAAAL